MTHPLAHLTAPFTWHTLDAAQVEERLVTSKSGLSSPEAAQRLAALGPNEVEEETSEKWWSLALRQFRDPLIYILLAAAAVTLALRDFTDTGVILVAVIINAVIGFTQEFRAREAIQALARLAAPRAVAVRDGRQREIRSRDLVPGDLVLLTSGSRVPADLRLTEVHDLAIDESVLTGESIPVDKTVAALPDPSLIAGDRTNMAYAATSVAHGRGQGIVVRTGAATELGQIAAAMRAVGRTATPLQESMARFGRLIGIMILGLVGLALVVGLVRGMPATEIFLTSVALAVSAIPEGLPVVLTVTLAVGVRRMARRRAIVRSLPAVETLGSTTVIGSDKTGTLTRNEMTVRAIWAGGRRYDVLGAGYSPEGRIEHGGAAVHAPDAPALIATLHTGVLASEAASGGLPEGEVSGDPTEIALLVAAAKAGVSPGDLHDAHPELDVLPFESERQFMVSLRSHPHGPVEHLKGAPEVVLERCDRVMAGNRVEELDRNAALATAAQLASEGLRVLAMAFRQAATHSISEDSLAGGFVLAGLVGMDDPVRPEAVGAVGDARGAGIRVIMLTGDHVDTARRVGERLGLGDAVLSGRELAQLPDADLDRVLREVSVYGRVTPEHKLRIVERLKERGEVVAVTGDGVNDAPALRAAHLGIAMGASGSDVAREASDMVLADDNFATIIGAVEEGRIVFANVRKVTFFLLSCAASEIIAILTALFLGWPLPFTAAQILWINLVTDGLEDLALAFEPGEPHLLRRPPRPRGEGVLTIRLVLRVIAVGTVIAVITLASFHWTLNSTGDLVLARTVAVTQLVVLQFYHVFNCRSLDRSVLRIPLLSNRFLFVSMVSVTLAHVAAVYTPFLQGVLRLTALDTTQWLLIAILGTGVVIGGELDKLLNRQARRPLG